MPAAFNAALAFAKGDNRRGASDLLKRQAVADLLSGTKMQTEAARALTWKAANSLENGLGNYNARRELALAAKIYCSDACTKVVTDTINLVGKYDDPSLLLASADVPPDLHTTQTGRSRVC